MPCYKPLDAYQLDDGRVVFAEVAGVRRPLTLPCGQCIGCRLERSRQWAVRCMHEASLYDASSFITLTYDEDHVPVDRSLRYSDFQKFLKRLRKYISKRRQPDNSLIDPDNKELRRDNVSFGNDERCTARSAKCFSYYMCGEYGELTSRPHYHACLFGVYFADRVIYRDLPSGAKLYTSSILSSLWPHGFCSVGDVTFESAAYVARYCLKKVTGDLADEHYKRVSADGEVYWIEPEFNHMSLKPAIGWRWFERYSKEVYPNDYVVSRGVKMKPPRAYDKLLAKLDGFDVDEVAFERYKKSVRLLADSTPDRLAVREKCAAARVNQLKRGFDNEA